jgi:hypothetical protein
MRHFESVEIGVSVSTIEKNAVYQIFSTLLINQIENFQDTILLVFTQTSDNHRPFRLVISPAH